MRSHRHPKLSLSSNGLLRITAPPNFLFFLYNIMCPYFVLQTCLCHHSCMSQISIPLLFLNELIFADDFIFKVDRSNWYHLLNCSFLESSLTSVSPLHLFWLQIPSVPPDHLNRTTPHHLLSYFSITHYRISWPGLLQWSPKRSLHFVPCPQQLFSTQQPKGSC